MCSLSFLQPSAQHPLCFLISTHNPFRTKTLMCTQTWGGHWVQEELRFSNEIIHKTPQDAIMRFSLILSTRTWMPTKWVFLFLSSLWLLMVWWLFKLNWLRDFGDFNLGVRFVIFHLRKRQIGGLWRMKVLAHCCFFLIFHFMAAFSHRYLIIINGVNFKLTEEPFWTFLKR